MVAVALLGVRVVTDGQTDGRTDGRTDATKYIISLASRSININGEGCKQSNESECNTTNHYGHSHNFVVTSIISSKFLPFLVLLVEPD